MTNRARSLVALSEKDLAHAVDNRTSHPRHAAFSIQQAAEKMIKAVLEQERVSHPTTSHQLDDLVGRVPPSNPFKADLLPLARLTSAATRYRYPTPRGEVPADPPPRELQEDIAAVRRLLPEVKDWLDEQDGA